MRNIKYALVGLPIIILVFLSCKVRLSESEVSASYSKHQIICATGKWDETEKTANELTEKVSSGQFGFVSAPSTVLPTSSRVTICVTGSK